MQLNFAQQKPTATIYFDTDSYELTAESETTLNAFIESAEMNKQQITLQGHTDNDGSDQYNQNLSENRVNTVLEYLNQYNPNQLTVAAHGEFKPVNQNADDSEKAKNRRVEIYANEIQFMEMSENKVFDQFQKQQQEFWFEGDELIEFKGREGTWIQIPAYALADEQGYVSKGKVRVQLTEYYNRTDMVLANLTTASNGDMIETAGTINVEAYNFKGERLQLRPGYNMAMRFRYRSATDNMDIFNGVFNSGNMNWELGEEDEKTKKNERMMDAYSYEVVETNIGGEQKMAYRMTKTSEKEEIHNSNNVLMGYDGGDYVKDEFIQYSKYLGWVNCDRFMMSGRELVNVKIKLDQELEPGFAMVFKNINSIMPGYYVSENEVQFLNIPVGEEVIVTAVATDENDQLHYSIQEVCIEKGQTIPISLKAGNKAEIKLEMQNTINPYETLASK
jgi:hypothetical protein